MPPSRASTGRCWMAGQFAWPKLVHANPADTAAVTRAVTVAAVTAVNVAVAVNVVVAVVVAVTTETGKLVCLIPEPNQKAGNQYRPFLVNV